MTKQFVCECEGVHALGLEKKIQVVSAWKKKANNIMILTVWLVCKLSVLLPPSKAHCMHLSHFRKEEEEKNVIKQHNNNL